MGLAVAASSGVRAQEGVNTNGSFEDAEVGVVEDFTEGVEGWVFEVGASVTDAPEFAIVDDVAYDGDQSLRVTVAAAGTNAWDIQAIASEIPATPGETYVYSVWARSEGGGGSAAFTVGNSAFNEYGALRNNIALTEEWQEFTFEFTVTDQETVIRAPIHFSYAANVGTAVYIDALRIYNPTTGLAPVVVEAESGTLGSDYEVGDAGDGVTYIAPATNFVDANFPTEGKTASYEVTFAAPGWYDLYARIYVGPNTFDDDSFFYASDFGERDPAVAADWIVANQLASAGFEEADQFVTGLGSVQSGAWKWVNLSENNLGAAPDSFYVEPGALTQTFEIGAREDGLWIDKLAFGRSDLYFTVGNLDNVEPGSETLPGEEEPMGPPLAEGYDKFLGNVYSPSQVEDFEFYWTQVTPENAGKWGSVEGSRDNMNWGGLDAAYALAKDNGLPYRHHVLVWGNQQPTWMASLSEEEQLEEIREWFEAVAERYPDIDYLEVVNEPLHDPPSDQPNDPSSGNYIEALGGSGETGWDWVITAFEMAREIFPAETKLMINDYGILGNPNNTPRYLGIIELLQERGLIDGIGVQGHAFSTRGSAAGLTATLDALATTGLPIQVTEMDVDGDPEAGGGLPEATSDANQLEAMQRIFPALWEHPAVEGVTMWGWRPGLWRTDQEAYLVRSDGEERPALTWLREYLEEYRGTPVEPGVEGPSAARLLANRPNPFGLTTRIPYTLSEPGDVTLRVFDTMGREVATLVSGYQAAGEHSVPFEAAGLASGVYLYRLEAGPHVQTRRMMLVK